MKISASFLSCKKIKDGIQKLSATDTDYIHVDLMDGTLYKGRKFSFRKLKRIFKSTRKRLDVHLMVKKPKKYIKKFSTLNTESITFQIETDKNIEKNLELIRSFGIKCGLAISPDTEISRLRPYLDKIDMVLVMSIVPGFGGQAFKEESVSRIETIYNMIQEANLDVKISVDGGINEETIKKLKHVDRVVAGSYITNQKKFQEAIDVLRKSA